VFIANAPTFLDEMRDPDGRHIDLPALAGAPAVVAPLAQAYHRTRARLTLTCRQIPAPLPAHARPRASASLRSSNPRPFQRGEGDMKRDNIEFMVGWLEALRRGDRRALLETLDPGVVWQGLEDEWLCSGPDEVVDVFTARRDEARELDAIELIGAERHAILHARGGGALASELPDGIYNVFAIEDRRIARIDDYADRESALSAAGLE
jgi:hypothetical protein